LRRYGASFDTVMAYVRKVEPTAVEWTGFSWDKGSFDTARRSYTEVVEGTICTPNHIVFVTLEGGARRLEVTSACGHRYTGGERPGAVSFVPAQCERRLKLLGVQSRWASIALRPSVFDDEAFAATDVMTALARATFTNRQDRFIVALVGEVARLHAEDGRLDAAYCDAMGWALSHYLVRRFSPTPSRIEQRAHHLPPWRMRKIAEYVDGHVGREVRISDLADLVGLSCGHLHRAFRATTGQTPLAFINERRIQRAMIMLAQDHASVAEVSLRCGFLSPSHFARLFRRATGVSPAAYRAAAAR
jgi:AraC family transcriptional regulator